MLLLCNHSVVVSQISNKPTCFLKYHVLCAFCCCNELFRSRTQASSIKVGSWRSRTWLIECRLTASSFEMKQSCNRHHVALLCGGGGRAGGPDPGATPRFISASLLRAVMGAQPCAGSSGVASRASFHHFSAAAMSTDRP